MKIYSLAFFVLVPLSIISGSAFAEDEVDPCDSKIEKVSSGTLASVGRYGAGVNSVDADTAGAAPGDAPSAVSGSIKYISDTKCTAVLTNKSECFSYNLSFEILSSKSGSGLVTSSTASLSPGGTKSLNFSCKRDLNYSLKITKSSSTKAKKK